MNDKQNLNNEHLSALTDGHLHSARDFLKDTKYTERNIKAQQSTRDKMNTAASMFALPLSPLALPLPAGSSLAAEASVSSHQSATVRRNRVRDSLLPHKQCWEFNYKIHVIVISY